MRHELAELVDLAIGHLQHAADVAQHAARLQRAESDDLGDAVAAVFFLDVADHFVAPFLAEVDVEVGHRHALGIEKALEQKPEADRIEIGDGERIGDKRACARAAARPDRDALRLRPLDEVGDDQKVAGIFHPRDDAELEIEPLLIFLRGMALRDAVTGKPPLEAALGFLAHHAGLVGFAVARGEARQDRRLALRPERAALGDLDGCRERFRQIGEQRRHFGAGLEAVLGRQLAAVGIGDELAFGDAKKRVVGFVILAGGKERLVGGDERQPAGVGELDQRRLGDAFGGRAVALQFDIEAVAVKPLQRLTARQRQRVLAARQGHIERAVRPAGERDQPFAFAVEPGEFQMRPLLRRVFEIGPRAKPHQAAVTALRRGQQHDARKDLVDRAVPHLLIAEIDTERAADDRLDAVARQFFGEFERPEHIVGVGERQRRLAVFLGELGEPPNHQRALEERIGRVDVQMDETGRCGRHCEVTSGH